MKRGADLGTAARLVVVVAWALVLSGNGRAAVVEWNGFKNDQWHEPANWSSAPLLPGATDNVVFSADPVLRSHVFHSQGSDTVKTLSANNWLTVANSQLTVTGNVTLSGGSQLHVEGPGASFRGEGSAFLLGPELVATAGGELSLPSAKHYTADQRFSYGLWATGAGSKLDLPMLEDITGGPARLNAQGGATINVPKLTDIHEMSGFQADGVGSKIVLSSVREFGRSRIDVRNGGEIVLSSEQIEYAEIRIAGAQSKLNLAHMTALETLDVGLTSGAQLDFPLVHRMTGGVFETRGGNAVLDLSAVTALDPPPPNTWGWPSLIAREQSRIDLSGIKQVDGASPRLEASGPGAVIDLSNLESYVGRGILRVSGGGKLLLPKLTRLDGPYVEIEGAGSEIPFDGLSSIDFFPIKVKFGAQVNLPHITGLNTASGGRGNSLSAEAGVIDVSNATALRGASDGQSLFEALSGGLVDLSGVGEVAVGNAAFRSTGVGSVVDLRRATRLTNTTNAMSVSASAGGRVRLDSLVAASALNWWPMELAQPLTFPSSKRLKNRRSASPTVQSLSCPE